MPRRGDLLHWGKRWLYLVHRWIGIATCLLFALWFASGLAMMYVPFPSLTQQERLEGLAPIDWGRVQTLAPTNDFLEQGVDGPVWRGAAAISATDSTSTATVGAARARAIAGAFGHAVPVAAERIVRDQWTVAGSFDRFRPLWKVSLSGPEGRVLYVASTNGAVVLDTRRTERFWNWLGSVPHWIYPTVVRTDQSLWRQVILWTAGPAIVVAVTGMWIGILRMRLSRRYKGGRVSPYRGWPWWHHIGGLVGGPLLVAWIFSGWLSVDPGRWFASEGIGDTARAAYAGEGFPPEIDWDRLAQMEEGQDARRAQLIWTDGTPVLLLWHADVHPAALDARSLEPFRFEPARLVRAAERLVPGARIEGTERLTAADAYWYEAKGEVELPMMRVRFADPEKTWVHISPATGQIQGDVNSRRRLYRWLFDALHRWDLNGLITNRPLWDIWMWLWSILGSLASVSGIIMGYRRLTRNGSPAAKARRSTARVPSGHPIGAADPRVPF